MTDAIHGIGYVITDHSPDYVVLGETHGYNFAQVTKAIRLISEGARFVATNPDPSGPSEEGLVPACGAMAALIEKASGVSPFFVGKPNPLMMRTALNYLGVHSEDTVMIGDRMDTDIVAGINSGMETILVLTGVTKREDVSRYPFVPTEIVSSIAEVPAPAAGLENAASYTPIQPSRTYVRGVLMATAVMMPKQGQSVESCIIVDWRKEPGDDVATGDVLCEVETDKAVLEVESPASGTLLERFFQEGDLVPVLVNIAAIGTAGEDASDLRPSL